MKVNECAFCGNELVAGEEDFCSYDCSQNYEIEYQEYRSESNE